MFRHGVEFRLALIVLLLTTGSVALAAGAAQDALTLPAAGLLFGGLYLAWEEVEHFRSGQH